MKKRKPLFSFLTMILLAIMVISGCNNGTTTNSEPNDNSSSSNTDSKSTSGSNELADEQVLNVSLITEPPTLHPGEVNNVTTSIVLNQVFEGLVIIDKNGEPQPAMASDIQVSDDQLSYTFTMRDGVKWSNGDPVTAGDFEYAWKHQLDPNNADTPYAYLMYVIKNAEAAKKGEVSLDEVGVKALDDKTLEVTLEKPVAYFQKLISGTSFYPINKKVAEANPDWALDAGDQYVSNGPFKLAEWEHKSKIVFKKNENYWDADSVKLETINMPIINDQNTEFKMFQQGELDFAGNPNGKLPLAAVPNLNKEGTLKAQFTGGTYYYTFNTEKEPFNNANIRKAFAYAINRQGIVENITQAGEVPALTFISSVIWDDTQPYFNDNDVEKAKELLQKGLEELGFSSVDQLPAITLSYNTSEEHAAIAQAIQDMWKKNLGVEVTLENNEWGVYLEKLAAGNYQVGRLGNSVIVPDAYTMMESYQYKGGDNYTNWTNDKFNELMQASTVEIDPEKRKEFLKQAETIFMDEMPLLPIYYYMSSYVQQDYVKDIVIRQGYVYYKWAYITKH